MEDHHSRRAFQGRIFQPTVSTVIQVPTVTFHQPRLRENQQLHLRLHSGVWRETDQHLDSHHPQQPADHHPHRLWLEARSVCEPQYQDPRRGDNNSCDTNHHWVGDLVPNEEGSDAGQEQPLHVLPTNSMIWSVTPIYSHHHSRPTPLIDYPLFYSPTP